MEIPTFEHADRAAIAALVALNLPTMKAADCFEVNPNGDPDPEAGPKLLAIADAYLAGFIPPRVHPKGIYGGRRCICCEATLISDMLYGQSFTWGIANGEGFCCKCRYPARAIHRIDVIGTINNFVLQYHPSILVFRDEEKVIHP